MSIIDRHVKINNTMKNEKTAKDPFLCGRGFFVYSSLRNKMITRKIFVITVSLIVTLTSWQRTASAQNDLPEPQRQQLSGDQNTLFNAQPLKAMIKDPNPPLELRRIPPPEGLTTAPETATATFSITYIPDGSTDLWGEACYTFPEEAKAAFNAAASIWANTLNSSVPITIEACWAQLSSSSTLGYSGGGPMHKNFTGAPLSNTWYSASLANALNGADLDPSSFDMHITYNSNFSWYYGTDGNTPYDKYDLMTVVLHEIAHGLNFSGTMQYSSGTGSWGYGTGYPNIYDMFMRDDSGTQLINTSSYPNPSTALGTALTSNDIWFHGSQAMAANGNQRVKMYAPSTWSSGSSYSHLDYTTFNNTSNQLMVYAISAGESIHDPGVITKGVLADLGWTSYTLNVNSSGASSIAITGNPVIYSGTTNYSESAISPDTDIILTAPSSTGSATFINWSGCNFTTSTDCTVSMTTNKTVTANYTPDAIALQHDVTVSNLSGAQDEMLNYYIAVPTGTHSLSVQIWGGSGNADLYVRYGSKPTLADWDYRSWNLDNTENIVISNPQAGIWYISANGYSAFSGVSLKAKFGSPWILFMPAILSKPQ